MYIHTHIYIYTHPNYLYIAFILDFCKILIVTSRMLKSMLIRYRWHVFDRNGHSTNLLLSVPNSNVLSQIVDETSVSEVAMVKLEEKKQLYGELMPVIVEVRAFSYSSALISLLPPLLRSYVDKATKPIADLAPGI